MKKTIFFVFLSLLALGAVYSILWWRAAVEIQEGLADVNGKARLVTVSFQQKGGVYGFPFSFHVDLDEVKINANFATPEARLTPLPQFSLAVPEVRIATSPIDLLWRKFPLRLANQQKVQIQMQDQTQPADIPPVTLTGESFATYHYDNQNREHFTLHYRDLQLTTDQTEDLGKMASLDFTVAFSDHDSDATGNIETHLQIDDYAVVTPPTVMTPFPANVNIKEISVRQSAVWSQEQYQSKGDIVIGKIDMPMLATFLPGFCIDRMELRYEGSAPRTAGEFSSIGNFLRQLQQKGFTFDLDIYEWECQGVKIGYAGKMLYGQAGIVLQDNSLWIENVAEFVKRLEYLGDYGLRIKNVIMFLQKSVEGGESAQRLEVPITIQEQILYAGSLPVGPVPF